MPLYLNNKRWSPTTPNPESTEFEPYIGSYTVQSQAHGEQILSTKNKGLKDDIVIEPVSYYETTNLSGGYTVIIGE